jgi:hypothetical protein
LKEKEKLEAEFEKTISIVKVKKAHKSIEDIEKLRKSPNIKPIIDRIDNNLEVINQINNTFTNLKKDDPKMNLNFKLDKDYLLQNLLNFLISTFESIQFDLEKICDINKQNFEKLFPNISMNFDSYFSTNLNLLCFKRELLDMKAYCIRLQ